ncbi:MFS transporter [Pseudoclavibacter chungangensis]|uniref:MFS transporter n=1 Tax=Pseudoclavibacter chungangensis TaxID=587635 RepID=A0A7J5BMW6_9MICO|nr:MFS transporter [Pseudoclavibacter chungangensis]KAB1652983.1 MFS transporter [Pseudoclavibacter chungangensis]NYJ65216.1 DHA2 family multidrug resistance protein-like MFS transporter [Pseudoclavibacter chungangensis]
MSTAAIPVITSPNRNATGTPDGHDPDAAPATTRTWLGLGVLVLAVFIICIDATVLDLAIPAISNALAPTSTQLLWIIDVYSFIVAGLLVTMGTLGDRIGRRKLLLIGAAGFGAASALAAWSTSAEMLILARALLGVAGATLMPSTLGLIRSMFPIARQRTTAIGIWAAMSGAGTAMGPLVGGWLLEHFWWGSVFVVNLPVMAALLVLGPIFIVESRNPNPGRFDLLSSVLSIVAIVGVVYAIKECAAHGIEAVPVAVGLVGLVVGWWFVRRQRRLDEPMLDLQLFRLPAFSAGVLTNLLSMFAFAGIIFFGSQYLQTVLGFGPLGAGFLMLPGMAASIVASLTAGSLARRLGVGVAIPLALVTAAAGALVLLLTGVHSGETAFLIGYVLLGSGVGVITTITSDLVVGTAPAHRASNASGVSEMGYELGIALGVAVLGSVLMGLYRQALDVSMLDPEQAAAARETVSGAMHVASEDGGALGAALHESAASAFVGGMHAASIATAVTLVVAAVVSVVLLRRGRV